MQHRGQNWILLFVSLLAISIGFYLLEFDITQYLVNPALLLKTGGQGYLLLAAVGILILSILSLLAQSKKGEKAEELLDYEVFKHKNHPCIPISIVSTSLPVSNQEEKNHPLPQPKKTAPKQEEENKEPANKEPGKHNDIFSIVEESSFDD